MAYEFDTQGRINYYIEDMEKKLVEKQVPERLKLMFLIGPFLNKATSLISSIIYENKETLTVQELTKILIEGTINYSSSLSQILDDEGKDKSTLELLSTISSQADDTVINAFKHLKNNYGPDEATNILKGLADYFDSIVGFKWLEKMMGGPQEVAKKGLESEIGMMAFFTIGLHHFISEYKHLQDFSIFKGFVKKNDS